MDEVFVRLTSEMGCRDARIVNLIVTLFFESDRKSVYFLLCDSREQPDKSAAIGATAEKSSSLGRLAIKMMQVKTNRFFNCGPQMLAHSFLILISFFDVSHVPIALK